MARHQSKRKTLNLKHKIIKKQNESRKKLQKLAKQNPLLLQRRKKEDPGIPNLWPFKEALLDEADQARMKEAESKQQARDKKKQTKERAQRREEAEENAQAAEMKTLRTPQGKREWYFRELTKVVEASDVIIEVLDARDPLGCRALDIERHIMRQMNKDGSPSKTLVLLLNKIDMVPAEVVADWVRFLKREYPTVAFKASTQKHRGHHSALDLKARNATSKALDSKSSVGAHDLLQLLKNYARSGAGHAKKSITVGVIGYPNVGKSSVINSLKMSRAVQVSAQPGCTKRAEEVKLDSNITLVDSPGVLFAADDEDGQKALLLRNVLRVEQVEDPVEAVEGIVQRCGREKLMVVYGLAEFNHTQEFLHMLGDKRGKLGKGGVPNVEDAARVVLSDWNSGKIKFHTLPPVTNDVAETRFVSEAAPAFDVRAFLDETNASTLQVLRDFGGVFGEAHMDDDDAAGSEDEAEGGGDGGSDGGGEMGDEDGDDRAASRPRSAAGAAAFRPAAVASRAPMSSGIIVEESDDEDRAAAAEAPLRNPKVGRGKLAAIAIGNNSYGAVPVSGSLAQMSKKALKKAQKASKRDIRSSAAAAAAVMEDGSSAAAGAPAAAAGGDYDFATDWK